MIQSCLNSLSFFFYLCRGEAVQFVIKTESKIAFFPNMKEMMIRN